ncbi:hypothetical protein BD769DRAFT_1554721 [Suillus cothurnatus]|nr:hypothetical protein BD769DRAFT_1554721 [Suillus cothurnatus]
MATLTIARAYQHAYHTYPNYTLAVTGGTLNALGDIVAQISQNILVKDHEPRPGWDPARTLRFFCLGSGMSPLLGRWNLFLERRFPLRAWRIQPINFRALSKRLVMFIGSMGVMECRSPRQIHEKYTDMFATRSSNQLESLAYSTIMINFRYMPLPYRIPFQSTCGVFWTLYLSILNAK